MIGLLSEIERESSGAREWLAVVVADGAPEFLALSAFSCTTCCDTRFAGGLRVAACAADVTG